MTRWLYGSGVAAAVVTALCWALVAFLLGWGIEAYRDKRGTERRTREALRRDGLLCLKCGYNLSNLPHDTTPTCPEFGHRR